MLSEIQYRAPRRSRNACGALEVQIVRFPSKINTGGASQNKHSSIMPQISTKPDALQIKQNNTAMGFERHGKWGAFCLQGSLELHCNDMMLAIQSVITESRSSYCSLVSEQLLLASPPMIRKSPWYSRIFNSTVFSYTKITPGAEMFW